MPDSRAYPAEARLEYIPSSRARVAESQTTKPQTCLNRLMQEGSDMTDGNETTLR